MFDGVANGMKIAREEIFGPVLSVIRFKTEAEAVALANALDYGLQASVWSDNLNRAHRVARALRAGTVHVNQYDEDDITVPFGGYKQSGNGRDKSLHALRQVHRAEDDLAAHRRGLTATPGDRHETLAERTDPGPQGGRHAARRGRRLPVFAERAENAELWDVEGRRYIDFGSAASRCSTPATAIRAWSRRDGRAARALHAHLPTRSCPTRATSRWPSGSTR